MKNHDLYRTFKVYIPELGQTIEDAYEERETANWLDLVVCNFLRHSCNECDGWEWMQTGQDNLVIAVEDDLGNKWSFNFSVDWEPSFGVYEVKKS